MDETRYRVNEPPILGFLFVSGRHGIHADVPGLDDEPFDFDFGVLNWREPSAWKGKELRESTHGIVHDVEDLAGGEGG